MGELNKVIDEMKRLSEHLMPYSHPNVDAKDETIIDVLKFRQIMVDGYEITLHYNKYEYEDHFLETLQIMGKKIPFIPFNLICKIARKALGDEHLSLIEILRESRKIYCWTVTKNKRGVPMPNSYKTKAEQCTYEGFEYNYVAPDQVDFY
jgi:hypothetical protein